MSPGASVRDRLRSRLCSRLELRREEIEQAVLARAHSVSDPAEVGDPAYVEGLRTAVSAALTHAIDALDSDERPDPVPAQLLTQARLAARGGVSLDTVLRRYVAGHALLDDFILQEAAKAGGSQAGELQEALRIEAATLDRLLDAVTSEYLAEAEARSRSRHRRRAEYVERLLAGELAGEPELNYELDAWHVGAVVVGRNAEAAVRRLALSLDLRPLLVPHDGNTLWAWLGARRKVDPREIDRQVEANWPSQTQMTIGEPAHGLAGWRLSHRQAIAALPVSTQSSSAVTRYADVALVASMLQDEVLVTSLNRLFLTPLAGERDGGKALRATLRAYFVAERNASSAAAALGITRQTVANRLHLVEELLGRSLSGCATELEAALRLHDLGPALRPARTEQDGE